MIFHPKDKKGQLMLQQSLIIMLMESGFREQPILFDDTIQGGRVFYRPMKDYHSRVIVETTCYPDGTVDPDSTIRVYGAIQGHLRGVLIDTPMTPAHNIVKKGEIDEIVSSTKNAMREAWHYIRTNGESEMTSMSDIWWRNSLT